MLRQKINNKFAFFDFDGTLVTIKSMFSFLEFYFIHVLRDRDRYHFFLARFRQLEEKGASRDMLNRLYYRQYAGCDWSSLADLGGAWYRFEERRNVHLLNQRVTTRLRELQNDGVQPVLVTGSMWPCVASFCQKFSISHVLCTELEMNGGVLTGAVKRPAIGAAKVDRILQFLALRQFDVDMTQCFAFGDHASDAGMLSLVGNAVAIRGDATLELIAEQKGWGLL